MTTTSDSSAHARTQPRVRRTAAGVLTAALGVLTVGGGEEGVEAGHLRDHRQTGPCNDGGIEGSGDPNSLEERDPKQDRREAKESGREEATSTKAASQPPKQANVAPAGQADTIRAWARSQGMQVADAGRPSPAAFDSVAAPAIRGCAHVSPCSSPRRACEDAMLLCLVKPRPIAERSSPMSRSPSQCPGTARSSTSAGRSLISVSGVTWAQVLRRDRSRGARKARPVRRHQTNSRLSAPRPWM